MTVPTTEIFQKTFSLQVCCDTGASRLDVDSTIEYIDLRVLTCISNIVFLYLHFVFNSDKWYTKNFVESTSDDADGCV